MTADGIRLGVPEKDAERSLMAAGRVLKSPVIDEYFRRGCSGRKDTQVII